MNPRDFEATLRLALRAAEADAPEPDGLVDRLLTIASAPARPGRRHRVALRSAPRWLPPLVAAAAIVAVVAGVTTWVADASGRHAPNPGHSIPVPSPSPKQSPAAAALSLGFDPAALDFITPTEGWVLGNVPCSAVPGYCPTLVHTTDGGSHWSLVSVPKGLTAVNDEGQMSGVTSATDPGDGSCDQIGTRYGPCVDQVLFTDSEHGYLWSFRDFYSTSDGGRTWQSDGRGYGAQAVVRAGGHVLRLVPIAACSSLSCPGELQVSPVGRAPWSTVTLGGAAKFDLDETGLSAADGTALFQTPTGGSGAARLASYRSTDGGTTWTTMPNSCADGRNADPGLAANGDIILECDLGGLHPTFTLAVSTNGGRRFGPAHPAPAVFSAGASVTAAAADRLIAVLQPGTVYASTDGGASWHPEPGGMQVASTGLAPVQFLSSRQGFSISPAGQLMQTTDGGLSWTLTNFY